MPLTRREFLIGSGVATVVTSPLIKALLKAVPEAKPVLTVPPKAYGRVLEIWAEAVGDKVARVSLKRSGALLQQDVLLMQSYCFPGTTFIHSFPPGHEIVSDGDVTLEAENGKAAMIVRDANSYHYITGGVYWEDA